MTEFRGINSAPLITEELATRTPSLVGVWPCADAVGTKVADLSGNGNDLLIQCLAQTDGYEGSESCANVSDYNYVLDTMWTRFPGFLSLGFGVGAMADITGELLANDDKLTLFGAEFIGDTVTTSFNGKAATAIDFDVGTYWLVMTLLPFTMRTLHLPKDLI